MRFTLSVIAVAVVLALVLPFGAEAGGNGAVKAAIYEADAFFIDPPGINRTYAVGDAAGFAILNATNDDTMRVMVKLQDALPDTTFVVTVVPGMWNAGTFSLATDGKGKGSVSFEIPIPEFYINNGAAAIKVILTSGTDIYATDDREPPFTNPPLDDLSTTHLVNLK